MTDGDHDWYGINVPAGNDLTVTVVPAAPNDFSVTLLDPGCGGTRPVSGLIGPRTAVLRDAPGGMYSLGIEPRTGGGNYLLIVTITP